MTGHRSLERRLFFWLVIAALAAVAILVLVMRSALDHKGPQTNSSPQNLTVTVDQQTFVMRDGRAELDGPPGSAAKDTLRIVGEPVTGDADGDGRSEAALLLRNDPGGSGTFYYAVLAVNGGIGYHASNVLALGDRIKPESIDYADGRFVYRFLERKTGEPMAAEPTVEKEVVVRFDPATGRISAVS